MLGLTTGLNRDQTSGGVVWSALRAAGPLLWERELQCDRG